MADRLSPRGSPAAAVILNWNGWELTSRCLDDLAASEQPLDIVLVDNGSTDGSAGQVRAAAGPRVDVVLLPRNLGFCGGMNVGMRRTLAKGYEYLWLLNNDVSVPPGACSGLVECLRSHPREMVLTPRLLTPAGREQHVGGRYALDGSLHRLLTCSAFSDAPASESWLTGTALFCRTSTAERLGPLDERFFPYWEDVDWSFRARRAGIGLAVAADVTITHHGAQGAGAFSSPHAAFLMARNELLFLRQHTRGRRQFAAVARVVARHLRWATLLERRREEAIVRALFAGLAAGLVVPCGRPRLAALPGVVVRALLARPLTSAQWLERAATSWDSSNSGESS
jgi:GT2 family glycosyltransferase